MLRYFKKLSGVLLICLSSLGILLFTFMIINELLKYFEFGSIDGGLSVFAFCIISIIIFIYLLILGIKLIKKNSKEENIIYDKSEYKISHSDKNSDNIKNINNQVFIKDNDIHIGKYNDYAPKDYIKYGIIYLFIMLLVAVILLIGFTFFSLIYLPKEIRNIISCFTVILFGIVLVSLSFKIGILINSMLLTFAMDKNKKLYLFDYNSREFKSRTKINIVSTGTISNILAIISYIFNSKQNAEIINEIDKNHIIENIMSSGNIYTYGQEINSVEKLSINKNNCKLILKLKREDESTYKRKIVIPKSYDNFDELLSVFKRLEMYN